MSVSEIPGRLAGVGLGSVAVLASTLPVGSAVRQLREQLSGVISVVRAIERRLVHLIDAPASLAAASAELRRISVAIESVPALRDDMAALPQTIGDLEARMTELLTAISELLGVVEQLAAATHPLHAATERLERLGERIEGERGGARRQRRWLRGGQDAASQAASS